MLCTSDAPVKVPTSRPPAQPGVPPGLQVICLGFPRTGTSSLRKALELLGYTFHPKESATEMGLSTTERRTWSRAIDAKMYGRGRRFAKEDWDELLGVASGTTAVIADLPHLIFSSELIDAYPHAKIILTTRKARNWWKSYSTMVEILLAPVARFPFVLPWNQRSVLSKRNFNVKALRAIFGHPQPNPEQARKRYEKHYESIRRLLPNVKPEGAYIALDSAAALGAKDPAVNLNEFHQRRLEYRVGEGWARLCAFLGKDAPAEEFPYTESWRQRQGYGTGILRQWINGFPSIESSLRTSLASIVVGLACAVFVYSGARRLGR
ncbi:hypothetical protein MIND_00188700 [Mycena indigotica]|uniref:P-loop containing nucleoside triphosphate hydrolase protein n=1 Tax=Mycena indigotica TaxID=2126181 RepID=A0A8H6T7I9_9AGAR|nr:uncharacterized protein MIND_00188700 [Mycena indigotica]KAF7311782.1 hypothetical protein MIND_00188700 [Mycena indigotica]